MTNQNSNYYNASHCPDPTASEAISHTKKEEARDIGELMSTLKYVTSKAGYEITNRIHLRNKRTGAEWK